MQREHYIRVKTQDPQFIWQMSIGILVAGLAVGFLAQFWPKSTKENLVNAIRLDHAVSKNLQRLVDDGDAAMEDVLECITYLDPEEFDTSQVSALLAKSTRPQIEREIIRELWQTIIANQPTDQLQRIADESPPVRYANYALAMFYGKQDDDATAAKHFEI